MTFYLNFYIIIYMFTLIQIQFLIKNFLPIKIITNSIPYLILYINKFSKIKNLFLFLFLSLSGLPPFLLFFIKFNFLLNLLYKLNIFNICLIFLIFFLNMLFYIQIFINKNINININMYIKKNKTKICYLQIINNIIFIIFLSINFYFYADLTYLIKLIYKWLH